ncbi:MAG: hypothetical protein Q7S93_11260 [Phenylobacterium sp.]|uniref:hypothetical protein n=1 Tax=Phenylobacterium sp. TaxID=1871053 RepID=UPI0027173CB3|nr:hypothetical protein [Phenylobacterium sp.]MDO8410623.1 hypothetical protein [Phenylobacterium sp.]
MTTSRREDVLVSVCFADAEFDEAGYGALRRLAQRLDESFRYWEILILDDGSRRHMEDDLLRAIENLRLLRTSLGMPFYRRRVAVAAEAIGDLVLLTSAEEICQIDAIAMLRTAERGGAIVVSRKPGRSALNLPLRILGRTAGFQVNAQDMLSSAFPRTQLNRLLARRDRELAIRFPPADGLTPVIWQVCDAARSRSRSLRETRRRFNLLHRLLVASAPRVLALLGLGSLFVVLSALAYIAYAIVVWLALDDVQSGWLTTSVVLGLTSAFLGTAIFGLSIGLQNLIELMATDASDDVLDERSAVDLFGRVIDELNVEISTGHAHPPPRGLDPRDNPRA